MTFTIRPRLAANLLFLVVYALFLASFNEGIWSHGFKFLFTNSGFAQLNLIAAPFLMFVWDYFMSRSGKRQHWGYIASAMWTSIWFLVLVYGYVIGMQYFGIILGGGNLSTGFMLGLYTFVAAIAFNFLTLVFLVISLVRLPVSFNLEKIKHK